jgi:hypothetical protein
MAHINRVSCAVILCTVLFGPALAGPNAGGVILLHCNEGIEFSSSSYDYCGQSGLSECAEADVRVDRETPAVFYALAAFPESSSPRMISVSFGVNYDPALLALVGHGRCADSEMTDDTWPAPATGAIVFWQTAQTGRLTEFYWFAAYDYAGAQASFQLTPHPWSEGLFCDDSSYGYLDPIADYGTLGFFTDGYLPCPPSNPALEVAEGERGDQPRLGLSVMGQPWTEGRPAEILVSLPREGPCDASLYDAFGCLRASLFRGVLPAGDTRLSWNGRSESGRGLESGVYFVVARWNGTTGSESVVVLK